MSRRIQVTKTHKSFCDDLEVMMDQVQQPEADEEHEDAFGGLECSYRPYSSSMGVC